MTCKIPGCDEVDLVRGLCRAEHWWTHQGRADVEELRLDELELEDEPEVDDGESE